MGEHPQEEGLLVDSAADDLVMAAPVRQSKLQKLAVVAGCAALVLAGYALGNQRRSVLGDQAIISESGAILTQADFQTLYATVMKAELTDAQRALTNEQITNNGATVTNANVKLLQTWYNAATKSNKIFANKLIIASVSSTSAKTVTEAPSTASVSCPVTTYAAFGSLYSKETAGQTWARIEKIDSWVRGALPAVGAPLSVRKLRDCYKSTLTTVEQKHFTDNAVAHMKAGAAR